MSTDVHDPPSWMFDADGELMKPELDLYHDLRLTDAQWDFWFDCWDALANARQSGRNGVKLIGGTGDPEQPRWIEVVDALIELGRLDHIPREAALRSEWIKYVGCPGCGSSGAFVRRDKATSGTKTFDKGQVRVSCGRRCKTRDVYAELGIETVPEPHVIEWDGAPATEDGGSAQMDAAAAFAREVELEAYRIRVREAARAKVDAERVGEVPPFDADMLGDILSRPQEPPHRVEGLIPSDASTLIVAQRKTGKTTFMLNLARSLLLGGDFLERFPVRAVTGRIGFLNYEVSAAQLAKWAAEVGIPGDRMFQVNLRGRRNPLGNTDDRERLAELLRKAEVEALIVDPFGRAYTGQSQNDAGEVGGWLAELDRYTRAEVGATDLVLATHAGWDGERTRGASALEDWADSIVTMVRSKDDDSDDRYLRAMGRDIDVEEDRLSFDPTTRTLSMTGDGNRRKAGKERAARELLPLVVQYVHDNPGCGQNDIENGLGKHAPAVREAARLAIAEGLIVMVKQGQKHTHWPPRPTASNRVQDAVANRVHRVYTGTRSRYVGGHTEEVPNVDAVACQDPAHTPRFDGKRWSCPDCKETDS